MKKFILIFCFAFVVVFCMVLNFSITAYCYADTFKVCDLDFEKDIVYIKNSTGFIYSFYGIEDYFIDDYVSCIMFNNCTKNIIDDKVISAKYCGF